MKKEELDIFKIVVSASALFLIFSIGNALGKDQIFNELFIYSEYVLGITLCIITLAVCILATATAQYLIRETILILSSIKKPERSIEYLAGYLNEHSLSETDMKEFLEKLDDDVLEAVRKIIPNL